jgi:hypothetical protein
MCSLQPSVTSPVQPCTDKQRGDVHAKGGAYAASCLSPHLCSSSVPTASASAMAQSTLLSAPDTISRRADSSSTTCTHNTHAGHATQKILNKVVNLVVH